MKYKIIKVLKHVTKLTDVVCYWGYLVNLDGVLKKEIPT
jgi:hypothetical protein